MPKNAFFISDLHLGAATRAALPHRAESFRDFLRFAAPRASHLFLLGDLFEFWMEYRHFIPKSEFRTLAALEAVRAAGVEVHYLAGNHDFALGDFFSRQLGMQVHAGPLALALQGKRLLLLHGDGLAPSDRAYRLLKRVLVHPLAGKAFRLLHPDLGMRLAGAVGQGSRDRHGYRPRKLDEYERAARALLAEGHDIVMHGHTHQGFVKRFPEGVYVNSGEWMRRLQFVELEEGECRLKEWDAGLREPSAPGQA